MWRIFKRFPVLSGLVIVCVGLGAYRLVETGHTLMLLCLVYSVGLYWWFMKDELE